MPRLPKLDCTRSYRDQAKYYDLMHKTYGTDPKLGDIAFWVKEAKRTKGPILEIACGTGRITLPIARTGADITGLDVSVEMLKYGKEKAAAESLKLPFVKADCRSFRLNRKFDLIFIPFNSMLHLHDRESLEAFWTCVKKHLAPKGRFIIDVFNPSMKYLVPSKKRWLEMKFYDPAEKVWVKVEGENAYDDAAQINRVIWFYSVGKRKDAFTELLNMHCYYPKELDALLHYNGFKVVRKYGMYDRRPFESGMPKQIIVCEKA